MISQALAIPAKRTGLQLVVPAMLCPSDLGTGTNINRQLLDETGASVPVSTSNYIASHGVCTWNKASGREPGPFAWNWGAKFSDIRDGQSSTILLGERASDKIRGTETGGAGVWAGVSVADDITFSTTLPSNSADCVMGLSYGLINPITGHSHMYSSEHDGGAHFLFADGAVHFMSENMHSYISGVAHVPTQRNGELSKHCPVFRMASSSGSSKSNCIRDRLCRHDDSIPNG